jgi:hypothetical protein
MDLADDMLQEPPAGATQPLLYQGKVQGLTHIACKQTSQLRHPIHRPRPKQAHRQRQPTHVAHQDHPCGWIWRTTCCGSHLQVP